MDGSSKKTPLELFDVGPCDEPYQMGFSIGHRFSCLIRSRVAGDLILQQQLLPFAQTPEAQPLLEALCSTNQHKFPRYWEELRGTAQGSGIPLLEIILMNFRKEIQAFLPKPNETLPQVMDDDCSDVLIVNDGMAIAAHNEDANVALVGHIYLVRATLPNGLVFTAYTYAGELPSCAFGFNNHGFAFTLNSVPPSPEEITAAGIGRNFISRHLLEATNIRDALDRIQSCNASVGHSYNLVDMNSRKIFNVETASGNRVSVHKIGVTPFFHANMYLHLQVHQVHDENSISRHRRADKLLAESKTRLLHILGDSEDGKYPIYMTGPALYTLCTALIDIDAQTLSIYEGNPKNEEVSYVFPIL